MYNVLSLILVEENPLIINPIDDTPIDVKDNNDKIIMTPYMFI